MKALTAVAAAEPHTPCSVRVGSISGRDPRFALSIHQAYFCLDGLSCRILGALKGRGQSRSSQSALSERSEDIRLTGRERSRAFNPFFSIVSVALRAAISSV
jgi:hypothetical protein